MKSNNLYMRKTNARLTNSLTMYEHYILYCTRQCSGFQPDENWGNLRTRNEIMWTRSPKQLLQRLSEVAVAHESEMSRKSQIQIRPENTVRSVRGLWAYFLCLHYFMIFIWLYSEQRSSDDWEKLVQPQKTARRAVNSRETSSIDYTTPDIMQSDMKSNNLYMRKTNARLTNSLTMYEHYILYCTRQCSGFQPDENWGNLRTRNEIMWTRSQREEGARSERRPSCRERNLTANASRAVTPDV